MLFIDHEPGFLQRYAAPCAKCHSGSYTVKPVLQIQSVLWPLGISLVRLKPSRDTEMQSLTWSQLATTQPSRHLPSVNLARRCFTSSFPTPSSFPAFRLVCPWQDNPGERRENSEQPRWAPLAFLWLSKPRRSLRGKGERRLESRPPRPSTGTGEGFSPAANRSSTAKRRPAAQTQQEWQESSFCLNSCPLAVCPSCEEAFSKVSCRWFL